MFKNYSRRFWDVLYLGAFSTGLGVLVLLLKQVHLLAYSDLPILTFTFALLVYCWYSDTMRPGLKVLYKIGAISVIQISFFLVEIICFVGLFSARAKR